MTDRKHDKQDDVWPLPKFYFTVQLGDGMDIKFQEVTGLQSETPVIEYRHGNSPVFSPIKMPGLDKVAVVTLRKGIFINDQKFWTWMSGINMNTISRRTVVINLLDETGAPTMAWTLHNAWPTKITSPDLNSDNNEVAVESVELACEGIEIKMS